MRNVWMIFELFLCTQQYIHVPESTQSHSNKLFAKWSNEMHLSKHIFGWPRKCLFKQIDWSTQILNFFARISRIAHPLHLAKCLISGSFLYRLLQCGAVFWIIFENIIQSKYLKSKKMPKKNTRELKSRRWSSL